MRWLAALWLLAMAQTGLGADCLRPFEAHYRLLFKGETVGRSYFRLRIAADRHYDLEAYTLPAGSLARRGDHEILEASSGRLEEGDVHPEHYLYGVRDGQGTHLYEMRFDPEAGRLQVTNGDQRQELPLAAHTQDRLSYLLRVMMTCGRADAPLRFPLAEPGSTREVVVKSGEIQRVRVPWGLSAARRMERYTEGDTPDRILWLSSTSGVVPVMLEHPTETGLARMELETLTGEGRGDRAEGRGPTGRPGAATSAPGPHPSP